MGVISIVIGIINQLITGGAPPCNSLQTGKTIEFDALLFSNVFFFHSELVVNTKGRWHETT